MIATPSFLFNRWQDFQSNSSRYCRPARPARSDVVHGVSLFITMHHVLSSSPFTHDTPALSHESRSPHPLLSNRSTSTPTTSGPLPTEPASSDQCDVLYGHVHYSHTTHVISYPLLNRTTNHASCYDVTHHPHLLFSSTRHAVLLLQWLHGLAADRARPARSDVVIHGVRASLHHHALVAILLFAQHATPAV